MNTQTEKMLSTSWNLVRDAGSAVSDAAVHSRVGTSLVKALPTVKSIVPRLSEMVSIGAGLALARKGSRAAVTAVRKHPLAAIAGAVALAGVGVAITIAKRRKQARENGAEPSSTRRLAAKNMRSDSKTAARTGSAKPASKTARVRKSKDGVSTH